MLHIVEQTQVRPAQQNEIRMNLIGSVLVEVGRLQSIKDTDI